jgi:hypothetical protein
MGRAASGQNKVANVVAIRELANGESQVPAPVPLRPTTVLCVCAEHHAPPGGC